MHGGDGPKYSENLRGNINQEERQKIVNFAKTGVRNRRGRRMQVIVLIISFVLCLCRNVCGFASDGTRYPAIIFPVHFGFSGNVFEVCSLHLDCHRFDHH